MWTSFISITSSSPFFIPSMFSRLRNSQLVWSVREQVSGSSDSIASSCANIFCCSAEERSERGFHSGAVAKVLAVEVLQQTTPVSFSCVQTQFGEEQTNAIENNCVYSTSDFESHTYNSFVLVKIKPCLTRVPFKLPTAYPCKCCSFSLLSALLLLKEANCFS